MIKISLYILFTTFSISALAEKTHMDKLKCLEKDGEACLKYGELLYNKRSIIAASTYFKKACHLKVALGCFKDGQVEEHDLGNLDFAIHRYRIACDLGAKQSCRHFERLQNLGFKSAPSPVNEFSVVKNMPVCKDAICKEEILNACKLGVKNVEKLIKEVHSKFKMGLICDRLINPKSPTDEHSQLQENFKLSYSYGYRKYCEIAVYGRVVSFKETNKTSPKKIDKWKKEICNDTSFPPDKKELNMREN
jgi:TPR repeat protein